MAQHEWFRRKFAHFVGLLAQVHRNLANCTCSFRPTSTSGRLGMTWKSLNRAGHPVERVPIPTDSMVIPKMPHSHPPDQDEGVSFILSSTAMCFDTFWQSPPPRSTSLHPWSSRILPSPSFQHLLTLRVVESWDQQAAVASPFMQDFVQSEVPVGRRRGLPNVFLTMALLLLWSRSSGWDLRNGCSWKNWKWMAGTSRRTYSP